MAVAASPLSAGLFLIGTAFGHALGPVLTPAVQDLRNFSWSEHRVRPLSAETAAALWVEGTWDFDRANTEAAYQGVSENRLRALHDLADDPPDLATMFALWRRNLVTDGEFNTALRRLRLEPEWFEALRLTKNVLISPAQLAAMRQQGYIERDEQIAEARLQGVTAERADLMFEQAGLPPGPEALLNMLRRDIINPIEFAQGIREGNTKTKYVDEYLALERPLLTPGQIVNQRLRGWRGHAWMVERLADYGFTAEDAQDMFEGQGRPTTPRQVFIGMRRGGVYNGGTGAIDAPYLKALQESNIRPEWYNIEWARRHSLPSAFVIRGLAQSGDLEPDVTRRLLMETGWPEFLIDAVLRAWYGATTGAESGYVKSARTAAITEIRQAYQLGTTDAGQARAWLAAVGVDAASIDGMVPIWDVMREVPQRDLTAAQIRKAYLKLPALWPRDRAIDELEGLGYTADSAATLLDS